VLLYNISYFVFGVCVVLSGSVWLASAKKYMAIGALVLLYIGSGTVIASSPVTSTSSTLNTGALDPEAAVASAESVKLRILVSVRPLALIAQAVAGDRAEVDVLVAAGQSPHHFSLKVSDRKRIAAADLVLWVGPELERFLVKPLRSAKRAMAVAAERDSAIVDVIDTVHSHEASSHPWLAPDAAIALAQRLASRLALLDPDSAGVYAANAEAFTVSIERLDQTLKASFANNKNAYAVAHDAYSNFSDHYGLPEPIVLSVSPEVSPGARKLWQLQSQLPPQSCVLVELEHKSRWLKALVETQQLRLHSVDTLAHNTSITRYADFLLNMAETFKACLD